MSRLGYRDAVELLATNYIDSQDSDADIASSLVVGVVADVYGKDASTVARAVRAYFRRHGIRRLSR